MTGPVGYWVRATTSGRRRGAVVLIALTVVAAVVPLVAGAAARRTSSSVGRMREELRPYHVDVQFYVGPPPDDSRERLASLDGVEVVGEGASVLWRAKCSVVELFQSFGQGPMVVAVGWTLER